MLPRRRLFRPDAVHLRHRRPRGHRPASSGSPNITPAPIFRPVQSIAKPRSPATAPTSSRALRFRWKSTALPALVIIAGILISYNSPGLFGIAIAVTTMLALAGIVVALDAFGPVTDNAGGIAEMAGLPKEVRKSTDALDAVGNTTKAVTKGYAIGSAGLGALVLFAAYNEDLNSSSPTPSSIRTSRASRRLLAQQSLRRRGPPVRRPVALPVRRHGHDRGRPRRSRDRRGSAAAVPRKARHHEGHATSRTTAARWTCSPRPRSRK